MPWSVIRNNKVWDVVVGRPGPKPLRELGYQQSEVYLYRTDHETKARSRIHLGTVFHIRHHLDAEHWDAIYYPLGHDHSVFARPERAQGFATRRYAIEHMLERCGWRHPDWDISVNEYNETMRLIVDQWESV